jgi:primosomal protein N' (replication factor Y)
LNFFVDVILPIPLTKLFTYKITKAEAAFLKPGVRIAVEFGKSKIYTALAYQIHNNEPTGYEAKDIHQILDEHPVVNALQLAHWEWIASYYICSLGEVFKAALPSAFLLESETVILPVAEFNAENELSDDEFLIYEALQHQSELSVHKTSEILGKKTVLPVLKNLIEKGVIILKERIYEQYKPKLIKYIKLSVKWNTQENLSILLEKLARAPKQHSIVLTYFRLAATNNSVKVSELKELDDFSQSAFSALVDKGIFEVFTIQTDRQDFDGETNTVKELSQLQNNALQAIKDHFNNKDTVLLKGITSSGKTEIYIKLIEEKLHQGKQVLYLLPEIALTTQIISRLEQYFGDYLSVFHSRYTMNERVEVWNNLLQNKQKSQLIVGARSAIFLPFSNLGLIIVDEEHEPSFKQFDPAPRYHARDAAIVLAKQHQSKILLGSATPSIETYYNANKGKYGYVELNQRFGNVLLPKMQLVDIKEKHRKKRMKGHFSDELLNEIKQALDQKEQIILFQNRRGFAPVVSCEVCGVTRQCIHCDVSLTYHSFKNELRCHYCGFKEAMPETCEACGSEKLSTKGFGTEQIELELHNYFEDAKIGRMDLDSTQGKHGYHKIIEQFQAQEISILVGTQMLSKGLDFSNVSLVGIMNADNMLNFPDFRAHERSYQLMVQVAGRAGRALKQGKVIIQTYNPQHPVLQLVAANDYEGLFKSQLTERKQYHYPPYYRLIKITMQHKNALTVFEGAKWLGRALNQLFKPNVLGPTTPGVSKIRNYYIQTIIIKIPKNQSLTVTKQHIIKVKNSFLAIKEYRSIRLNIDVDNY